MAPGSVGKSVQFSFEVEFDQSSAGINFSMRESRFISCISEIIFWTFLLPNLDRIRWICDFKVEGSTHFFLQMSLRDIPFVSRYSISSSVGVRVETMFSRYSRLFS